MAESRELLKVADLATDMGVTPSRVYQLLRAGVLPSVRIGGAIRVPKDAWRAWLDQQRDRALKAVREP
jgi:excisionase family DNA binding protein